METCVRELILVLREQTSVFLLGEIWLLVILKVTTPKNYNQGPHSVNFLRILVDP